MSALDERSRGVLVAVACVGLLALGARAALRDPAASPTASLPSEEEMDSLQRYLAPVAEAPPLDDYDDYLPARAPRSAGAAAAETPPQTAERALSAIMLAGEIPLAIIDDQPVRPGQRLSGGAEVVTIASDHVVIREPGGALRTLRLSTGDKGPDDR